MFHGLDLAQAHIAHRVGGEAECFGQPERGSLRGAARAAALLRMRDSGPDRSDKTLKWEVRSLPLLVERVIPHFRRYPMRSGKQGDFEHFAATCEAMTRGVHLTTAGLVEIVRRAATMNPSGKRGYSPEAIVESVLRGEGIVCPSGNRGL